jgi:hypothetical protein
MAGFARRRAADSNSQISALRDQRHVSAVSLATREPQKLQEGRNGGCHRHPVVALLSPHKTKHLRWIGPEVNNEDRVRAQAEVRNENRLSRVDPLEGTVVLPVLRIAFGIFRHGSERWREEDDAVFVWGKRLHNRRIHDG